MNPDCHRREVCQKSFAFQSFRSSPILSLTLKKQQWSLVSKCFCTQYTDDKVWGDFDREMEKDIRGFPINVTVAASRANTASNDLDSILTRAAVRAVCTFLCDIVGFLSHPKDAIGALIGHQ